MLVGRPVLLSCVKLRCVGSLAVVVKRRWCTGKYGEGQNSRHLDGFILVKEVKFSIIGVTVEPVKERFLFRQEMSSVAVVNGI